MIQLVGGAERAPVLAVMGPTAAGKTRLAVELAVWCGGELVNADSRQAIAELEVGVCKPSQAELRGVSCAGLDWAHLGRPFSAAEFRHLAEPVVGDILRRHRPAILVGGSGLYLRSLMEGFDFGNLGGRDRAGDHELAAEDLANAHSELDRLAPSWAADVDRANPRRVLRAAQLARAGTEPRLEPPGWPVLKLGCRVEPAELKARIRQRSERLLGDALRREVEDLLGKGFTGAQLGAAAIGYAEAVEWIEGGCSREQALERLERRTWHYARAQMTWLRRERDLVWIDGAGSFGDMVSAAKSAWGWDLGRETA